MPQRTGLRLAHSVASGGLHGTQNLRPAAGGRGHPSGVVYERIFGVTSACVRRREKLIDLIWRGNRRRGPRGAAWQF